MLRVDAKIKSGLKIPPLWQLCTTTRASATYPFPNMMNFNTRVASCKVFSKKDLQKGTHQIPPEPEDISKMAIKMLFGLFKFTCMTFSMWNAGNRFQRII